VSVTLACAWRPRGEIHRFQEIRPQLEQVYEELTKTRGGNVR
jgi:hypothetical protein